MQNPFGTACSKNLENSYITTEQTDGIFKNFMCEKFEYKWEKVMDLMGDKKAIIRCIVVTVL